MDDIKKICIDKLTKEPQNIKKSNDLWDKRAKEFSKMSKNNHKDSSITFLKRYVNLNNSRIIDLGSGSGKYLKLLMDEGAIVEGLEPSTEMIKQAKNIYLNLDIKKILLYTIQHFKILNPKKLMIMYLYLTVL